MGRAKTSIAGIDTLNQDAWELRTSEPEKASELAKKALSKSQRLNYTKGIAECRRTIAMLAFRSDVYAVAYENALLSAKLFQEIGDIQNEAIVLNILGGIYNYLGDHKHRLEANLRSLQLRRKVGDRMDILTSMNNTGDTYIKLGDYDRALSLFYECLDIVGDERDKIRAIVLCNIGEIKMLQGEYPEAIEILEESLDISREIDYTQIVIVDLLMLGNINIINSEPKAAISQLQEALEIAVSIQSHRDISEAHDLLSRAWQNLDKPETALEHFKKFFHHKNLVINEEKLTELKNIQFKNELATYQTTNERLEKEVKARTEELRQAYKEQQTALEVERTVNQFSSSLHTLNTIDDLVWGLAKNCISRLDFVDCVIYLMDDERKVLVQRAAYGIKNPKDYDIMNPIEIPIGKGIVGSVAQSGQAELIGDTSQDPRYIIDDEVRLAEIAVPIISGSKIIGVIDSEHPEKNFFSEKHLRILTTIASLCANKIEHIKAEEYKEKLQQELIDQLRKNEELQTKVNRELEEKVQERTLEIEQQRKDITDSINYARTIQDSLLPSNAVLKSHFPDIFIYYQPKDIVSGDFYWVGERDIESVLAIADSTGHGVPGALMSVLGSSKLGLALERTNHPGEILSIINKEVKKALSQTMPDSISKDGMDMAIIKHNPNKKTLEYAGAHRPFWLIRDGKLTEIRATRSSLGGLSSNDQNFETHTIKVKKGDMVYLFTDGYADQFGGNNGRKMMIRRFRELLLKIAPFELRQQEERLKDYFNNWKGEKAQIDDILVAGIKF